MFTLKAINEKIEALKIGERFCIQGVPEDIYHASHGEGSSALKAATKSMAHYKAYKEKVFSTTEAMQVGSATHCLVFEADLYTTKFIQKPESIKVRRGKQWDKFASDNADKTILTDKNVQEASRYSSAVLDSGGQFFIGGKAEVSYWYRHPKGIVLKARADYVLGDCIIDLKTTKDKTPEEFLRTVKYDYRIQDASYRMVTGLADMHFFGISKEETNPVFLATQGAEVRERAEKEIEAAIDSINEAAEFDHYPNYELKLLETSLTDYEKGQSAS